MTTAMSKNLPAPTTDAPLNLEATIVPAPNPTVMYLDVIISGGTPLVVYQTQCGLRVSLGFDASWNKDKLPATLVIQLPTGWTLSPGDTDLTWVDSAPIWVGQVPAATIDAIVNNKAPTVTSHFSLVDPSREKRYDPAVIIRKEG